MDTPDKVFDHEDGSHVQDDLRPKIAQHLLDRREQIVADTMALFPYSRSESLDVDYCNRVCHLLTELLAHAVRDGQVDARGRFVGDLHHVILERTLTMDQLFTFTYLTERISLDELALDETFGATTEPWPLVAQLVRRASFDLLGAYTERAQLEPSESAVIDRLTTLYTRPLFDAVMSKEVERAGRYGYPISLIMFDVDHLSAINQEHGYGVGDKILERLVILIRKYFRLHDWVARYSEDSIAVLLPQTEADNAADLAERVRNTVEKRLGLVDHRNDTAVPVTLSAAVVNVNVEVGDVIDADRFLADAEAAVDQAKRNGRNRVERLDTLSKAAHTRAAEN